MPLTFKIRGPTGLMDFCNIDEELSFSDLYLKINKETGVGIDDIILSKGFPPKTIEIDDLQYPIGAFIENNETLTLIAKASSPLSATPSSASHSSSPSSSSPSSSSPSSSSPSSSSPSSSSPSSSSPSSSSSLSAPSYPPSNGIVMTGPLKDLCIIRRVMINDNSCLFHALHEMLRAYYVDSPYSLRELVSNTIRNNPNEYASFLSKPPFEYVQWITKEISWGGAVELSIVSKHYNIEIDAINVQDLTVFRFNHPPDPEEKPGSDSEAKEASPAGKEGEQKQEAAPNPTARGIVCYDGSHYDMFAFNDDLWSPAATDVTLFDMEDPEPLRMALEVCTSLKKMGLFVDDDMELVCGICGEKIYGNNGVLNHGQETSHYDFRPLK